MAIRDVRWSEAQSFGAVERQKQEEEQQQQNMGGEGKVRFDLICIGARVVLMLGCGVSGGR